jgi:hypothetical protein
MKSISFRMHLPVMGFAGEDRAHEQFEALSGLLWSKNEYRSLF